MDNAISTKKKRQPKKKQTKKTKKKKPIHAYCYKNVAAAPLRSLEHAVLADVNMNYR